MAGLEYFESLPKFRIAVKSIYLELGESFNRHATMTNLSRHTDKNDRQFVRGVVKVFLKTGLLRKHRPDTFAWPNSGLEYAKRIIF